MTAPRFEALLAVQDLDTAIAQHRHRRASLPARMELSALDEALAGLEVRLSAATARRDEVARRQEALETDLTATEDRIGQVNKRLYGGTVSATRELQAMAAEVESLQARASDFESRVLEVMEEREPLDAEVSALDGQRASLLRTRASVEERLGVAVTRVDSEIDALSARRQDAVRSVPVDLLATYDRLRQQLGGVGAARLVASSCTGCHLTLPATELDHLRRQPPDALLFCDQCGRILVRP